MRSLALTSILFACACSSGPFDRPKLPDNPLGDECKAGEPPREPDLMRWRPDGRAQLSLVRQHGIVAVRYEPKGCDFDLEVLPNCSGKGTYAFSPYSSDDTKNSHSETELKANLPIGGVELGGYFKDGHVLRTDVQLAGILALPPGELYPRDRLEGTDCDRATHVVARIYLGGFSMVAGAAKTVEGGASFFSAGLRARDDAGVERVTSEGVASACERARNEGTELPTCNVPLRVGLLPLGTAIDPQDYLPDPKDGLPPLAVADKHGCIDKAQLWDGTRCVNIQSHEHEKECPEHFYLDAAGKECKACIPHLLARGCP